MKISNIENPKTLLTEHTGSVFSGLTRVISCRALRKKCCIALKMNFKFNAALFSVTLHVHAVTPHTTRKTDAVYSVSIV